MWSWLGGATSTPAKSAAPSSASAQEGSLSSFQRDALDYYKQTNERQPVEDDDGDDEKVYRYGDEYEISTPKKKTLHAPVMTPPSSGKVNVDSSAAFQKEDSPDEYAAYVRIFEPVPGTLNKYSTEDDIYLPLSTRVLASVLEHPEDYRCKAFAEVEDF
jgi:hypothetical protein